MTLINKELITKIEVFYKKNSNYKFIPEKKFLFFIIKSRWEWAGYEMSIDDMVIENNKAYLKPFMNIHFGDDYECLEFEDKESLDAYINQHFNDRKYLIINDQR